MVDAIGTATGAAAAAQAPGRTRLEDVMGAVAKELGMSTDDLSQQLRGGQSLEQIAAGKGVSHDDLVATISKALQSSQTQPTSTDPSRIEQLAERIATAKGRHHHHHRGASGVAATGTSPATTAASTDASATTGTTTGNTVGTRLDAVG